MGTCGLCGSEVKDTPYRESVSKPEPSVVVPNKADTFWIRVADNKIVALLILGLTVSGIIYAVDGLFHYTPGMHAAIGFATLTVVLVAMAALPYHLGKWFTHSSNRAVVYMRGTMTFPKEGYWGTGIGLVIAPICFSVMAFATCITIGAAGWGIFHLLSSLGQLITSLI